MKLKSDNGIISLGSLKTTLKNKFNRITELNYSISRMRYLNELHRIESRFERSPIFIFQMGKVASKSLTDSIKNVIPDRNVYHFHLLNPDSLEEHLDFRKRRGPPYTKEEFGMFWRAEYIRNLLVPATSQFS